MAEYILREEALEAQNKSMNLAECRKRLERIPAADVREVKHGAWKHINGGYYACTSCHRLTEVEKTFGNIIYNFCPHCGSDMREVEHD